MEHQPDSALKPDLKYLVENGSKTSGQSVQTGAKEITLLDPACGSGYILVTAFDLYMMIYKEEGLTTRQAVREILQNNLFGLDIDKRAVQLACFAVLMKAASYKYFSYKYFENVFEINKDLIIPLSNDESPFPDNAIKRIKDVLICIWGAGTLTENINFINSGLGVSYEKFLAKKFWDYRKRVYQKRPIYWLFASPGGSFKVLVYMHRMDKFTVQKIRLNYLHRYIEYFTNQIQRAETNRTSPRALDKLNKALQDCREYDKILKPLADQQIIFDLDDGVTVNYEKFKPALAPLK